MVLTKFVHAATVALVAAAFVSDALAQPRVHSGVHRTLRAQGSVNIIVTLKHGTQEIVSSVKESSYDSRGAQIQALVTRLQAHAVETQSEIAKVIAQESSDNAALYSMAQSYWISNQVYFKDASLELVEKLAVLPSVAEIREEIVVSLPTLTVHADNATAPTLSRNKNEWGVTKILATDVWAAGFKGQGVVVGSIDSGVRYTHEALKGSWRRDYGWFDPTANSTEPYDDLGHGTHTTGTITGAGGIGVAPGAQWIGCRACKQAIPFAECTESDLLACGQFMTCPSDPSGNNRDCSKAPHIINNSWGGGQGETFYDGVINAWRAAGIIPIFSNGNDGPNCGTANSPADNPNVIAVGMTDRWDALDLGSSKGPAVSGLIKPDLSAPGSGVLSSYFDDDVSYVSETGTSMAAPHVSGVVAILLSAKPSLQYEEVKQILLSTTDTSTLQATGFTCGGTADTVFPNNQYGHGRLNALKAYNLATSSNATAAPTEPPSICDPLSFFNCRRTKGCTWGEEGCISTPSTN